MRAAYTSRDGMSEYDRIARTLELLTPVEVPEILRLIGVLEKSRSMTHEVAEEWRLAVRVKAAEFVDPVASA